MCVFPSSGVDHALTGLPMEQRVPAYQRDTKTRRYPPTVMVRYRFVLFVFCVGHGAINRAAGPVNGHLRSRGSLCVCFVVCLFFVYTCTIRVLSTL